MSETSDLQIVGQWAYGASFTLAWMDQFIYKLRLDLRLYRHYSGRIFAKHAVMALRA